MGLLTRNADDNVNETQLLLDELRAREQVLELRGEYEAPTISEVGETTAVFPIKLYYDGEEYGRTTREFLVPDNGLADKDSDLVLFLAKKHGIPPEEVDLTDVTAVEGYTTTMQLDTDGVHRPVSTPE